MAFVRFYAKGRLFKDGFLDAWFEADQASATVIAGEADTATVAATATPATLGSVVLTPAFDAESYTGIQLSDGSGNTGYVVNGKAVTKAATAACYKVVTVTVTPSVSGADSGVTLAQALSAITETKYKVTVTPSAQAIVVPLASSTPQASEISALWNATTTTAAVSADLTIDATADTVYFLVGIRVVSSGDTAEASSVYSGCGLSASVTNIA